MAGVPGCRTGDLLDFSPVRRIGDPQLSVALEGMAVGPDAVPGRCALASYGALLHCSLGQTRADPVHFPVLFRRAYGNPADCRCRTSRLFHTAPPGDANLMCESAVGRNRSIAPFRSERPTPLIGRIDRETDVYRLACCE